MDKTHVQYILSFDYRNEDSSEAYLDEANNTLLIDTILEFYSRNSAALEIGEKLNFD